MSKAIPLAERIVEGIEIAPDGCWLWQRCTDVSGYGHIRINNKTFQAHRVAYEEFVGPIPDGLVIDHLCRVRHCVNPSHMETVTVWENNVRSPWNSDSQCRNGHPRTDDNTRVRRDGSRNCKECAREARALRRVGQSMPRPRLHGFDRRTQTERQWRQDKART